jgi:2-isopropylmalate synthase
MLVSDSEIEIEGEGTGPIDAFMNALAGTLNESINVVDYQEYAMNAGSEAKAISIIAISGGNTDKCFGVGMSQNTTTAAFKSIVAAINRLWR